MGTTCYAMVRGSGIRVTGLTKRGAVPDPILFAASKAVAKVTVNEITESASNELVSTDEAGENRLHLVRPEQPITYTVDADFLRVDPGVLSLVAGVPVVLNAAGDVVGFDSDTRRTAVAFALEVWTRLAGARCADGTPQYGYTILPFLKGGYLSGFEFSNGLVSFNLRGAKARKIPLWGVGPYDLEGPHQRLVGLVSGNTLIRSTLTTAVPPTQMPGVQETTDVIDGGTASVTSTDVIDGEFVVTSEWIVEGGGA